MRLKNKSIIVLAEQLYEDLELWYPYYRLKEAGARVVVAGTGDECYTGKHGLVVRPDLSVNDARSEEFDAVVIPGGYAPDHMRRHRSLLNFVAAMDQRRKVVAFICHAGWVPISAGIVEGRRMTSFPSIRDDLANAGAEWVDKEVVHDGNLVSSRRPDDLPAFCRTLIGLLAETP